MDKNRKWIRWGGMKAEDWYRKREREREMCKCMLKGFKRFFYSNSSMILLYLQPFQSCISLKNLFPFSVSFVISHFVSFNVN